MSEFKKTCAVIDLLQKHPNGLSAEQAAEALGEKYGTVTSRLSKLALYRVIDRIPFPGYQNGAKYLYRFRAAG